MQLNIVIRKRDLQLTATSSSIVKVIESRTVNNQGRKIGSRNLTLLLIHNKGRKIGSRNLTLIHNNGDRKSVSQQGGTGSVGCKVARVALAALESSLKFMLYFLLIPCRLSLLGSLMSLRSPSTSCGSLISGH